MRTSILRACLAALLLGMSVSVLAQAQTVTVAGEAAIVGNDVAGAREAALRNALAAAARTGSMRVSSQQRVENSVLESDQTTLQTDARVLRHTVLKEGRQGATYQVLIRAELGDDGGARIDEAAAPQACRSGYTKRLLIGGFPLARPEELGQDELAGYAQLTAREMARHIHPDIPVLVDTQGALQVRFALPETVSPDVPIEPQTWAQVRDAARRHRAQYVLVPTNASATFRLFSYTGTDISKARMVEDMELPNTTGSTEEEQWTAVFEDLPMVNDQDVPLNYIAKEINCTPGYEAYYT
ncbi:MAG: flagellar assembly protein T N-terminal domain-containing protein, partial [Rhodocyclaceae bacterium]|nr:flagellar assembly protein T N-terminal domain-containing protein [Rhodocyclaceae bacterium]